MTPEQALQMIDEIVAQIQLSRPDHARIQQAVGVLAQMIEQLRKLEAERTEGKEKDEPGT